MPAGRVRQGRTYVPGVDIVENERELLLMADIPGVKAGNLAVSYERGVLTIRGAVAPRQDAEKTQFVIREYGVGDYCRTFQIGEAIDATKIEAELRDGVLTLHLPKHEEVLPRKIAIRTN
ncbi:MAG: Hsp20/alpha crystallin family protein [Phycisphaerales bacterium]|nr:Hsp20/alpha crystallin family protein [Phycisphaerales bacterium]